MITEPQSRQITAQGANRLTDISGTACCGFAKPLAEGSLVTAMRATLDDKPQDFGRLGESDVARSALDLLTPREREVFAELSLGRPRHMIIHQLGMSPRTLEILRARVLEKMAAAAV